MFENRICYFKFQPPSIQGRIFIDRSGDLFAILLQYARTLQRPPQAVLDNHGDSLIAECCFFGNESLAEKIRGETCSLDLLPMDRRIREQEELAKENPSEHADMLIDLLEIRVASTVPRLQPRETLELPVLLTGVDPPTVVEGLTFAEFRERLNVFSGNLLEELEDIPGSAQLDRRYTQKKSCAF